MPGTPTAFGEVGGYPRARVSRRRRLLLAGVIVPPLLGVVSLFPFFWPAESKLRPADAVFVLSGDHGERQGAALQAVDSGIAPVLVFVGTPDNLSEDEFCAGRRPPYRAICLRPQPDNTREEARAGAELAEREGWDHIVVATSTQHVTRARLLFQRCFSGRVSVIGSRPPYDFKTLLGQVAHEWAAVAHALVAERGC